jgi:hypothetical protein
VQGINRRAAHAPLRSFPSAATAAAHHARAPPLADPLADCPRVARLSGRPWQFRLFDRVADVPEGFWAPGFDASGFCEVRGARPRQRGAWRVRVPLRCKSYRGQIQAQACTACGCSGTRRLPLRAARFPFCRWEQAGALLSFQYASRPPADRRARELGVPGPRHAHLLKPCIYNPG